MVLSSRPWSLREFSRFIWWMQTERRVASNPQTKPSDLGCESANKWLLPSTSSIAICYYYSPQSWYSFYRPTEGERLSRPRHCRKGAQPVPKAAHRSGCRDKHNWPRPLKPQSIMQSLNHCDLLRHLGVNNLPRQRRGRELNSQPASCKFMATSLPSQHLSTINMVFSDEDKISIKKFVFEGVRMKEVDRRISREKLDNVSC